MCYTFIHDVAVTFEIKFVLSYDLFSIMLSKDEF